MAFFLSNQQLSHKSCQEQFQDATEVIDPPVMQAQVQTIGHTQTQTAAHKPFQIEKGKNAQNCQSEQDQGMILKFRQSTVFSWKKKIEGKRNR